MSRRKFMPLRFTLHNVCAVHRGVCSTTGNFSTLGDIMSTVGGYHYKCGGRSLRKQLNLYGTSVY